MKSATVDHEELRMAGDQRGIQSVEVGGQLLRVLAEADGPMMLRDLAKKADMSAAKAHPYLVSFMRIGMVEQNKATGRYELGSLALQIGLASMRRLEPVRVAAALVSGLVETIGQTVALAVWGNHGPTVVRIEEGVSAVHVNMRVGSVMSLLGTATGRVFAAFLPPKMIEAFLDSDIGRASVGDELARTMSRKQIEASVAEVRERGLARAVDRPIPGVNALTAPVFDQTGSIVLAITAIGPSGTFDADWEGPIARELLACAGTVSARLGFLRPAERQAL
ncbi:IclR family transcriptional regulator [Thalassobaculum sp.]|uniref:IclR family transcriptional regulator n=1 Tax=Thalassobaculum sp. TaxID=2022740 RepID=UPI0032ECE91D